MNLFKSRTRRRLEIAIAELESEIAGFEAEKKRYEKNPHLYAKFWALQKECEKRLETLKDIL